MERVLGPDQVLKVMMNGEVVLKVTCGAGTTSSNTNNGASNNVIEEEELNATKIKPFTPSGGKRKTRKNRKAMDGGAKKKTGKRAPNAYMEFCGKHRAAVVAANPKASVTEIAKILGKMYREQKQ